MNILLGRINWMKKIVAPILGFVFLFLFCWLVESGIFGSIINFFTWLFTYNYSNNGLNNAFALISKLMIFGITYPLVGLIFSSLGWFNSKIMAVVYFILSTLLAMLICPVLKLIQDNIVTVGIVLLVIFILLIGLLMFIHFKDTKKEVLENDTI